MSLLQGYSSSSEDEQTVSESKVLVNFKPDVEIEDELIPYNARDTQDKKKTISGYAQNEVYDDAKFQLQKRSFDMLGYSVEAGGVLGDAKSALKHGNIDISQYKNSKKESKQIKKQRNSRGGPGITTGKHAYQGSWAKYDNTSSSDFASETDSVVEVEEDIEEDDDMKEQFKAKKTALPETTEFFGSQEFDYQGRTYMHVPRDLDLDLTKTPGEQECFVPKRCIHRWDGHVGGTNQLRFIPQSGHLLLSCGNDGKVLLYDAFHDRQLLRGYFGHSQAVKDITFNNKGDKFLSCSYDKYVKEWDTETGKCINKIKMDAIPNLIKYNLNENAQDEFLVGLSNKKIEQYDLRTKEVIQTYDHHLGAINSITLIDDNKKFMTSSDDKSLRIWNWQINVPVKFITDPTQHSMPCVKLHPAGKYVAAQSMNNTIEVIGARGNKFKRNKKKLFSGHNCAGYGIGIDFSADGKIMMSGDNNGYGFFWDWKTCKLVTKLKIDEKLISCIELNPQEVSKVAMSGLSGTIYYYE